MKSLFAFAAVIAALPALSETTISHCADIQFCEVTITGTISASDATQLTQLVNRMSESRDNLSIRLDTRGGDLMSAMVIGRLLRRMQGAASVYPKGTCASACVLILAGAVNRTFSLGRVGIHSPYDAADLPADYAAAKKKLDTIRKLVVAYLEEMNVSSALFDEMIRTPAHDIRYLSRSELEGFGITARDPAFEMAHDAAQAREFGIPLPELLRRKALRERHCPLSTDPAAFLPCFDTVMKTGRPP